MGIIHLAVTGRATGVLKTAESKGEKLVSQYRAISTLTDKQINVRNNPAICSREFLRHFASHLIVNRASKSGTGAFPWSFCAGLPRFSCQLGHGGRKERQRPNDPSDHALAQ